ncbi:MAG: hypothetical protein AAF443_08125 [Chlamydiota bacterium]
MSNCKIIDAHFLQDDAEIESVESSLSFSVVSPKSLQKIAIKIDQLEDRASCPEKHEKLVSFYGKLESFAVNNEIDEIFEAALDLNNSDESAEIKAAKEQSLEKKVQMLWYHHALSSENRRYVKVILQKLRGQDAEATPKGNTCIGLRSRHAEEEQANGNLALTLCEVAYFFYGNKIQSGQRLLNQLTPSQKKRLQEHLLAMGAEEVAAVSTSDLNAHRENLIHFIQAILGYANELAQGDDIFFYPSPEEINMMFAEIDEL